MRRGRSRRRRDIIRSRGEETYPLPEDTRSLVKTQAERCLNYGLRLDRLPLWRREEDKWELAGESKERFTRRVGGRKVLDFTSPDL